MKIDTKVLLIYGVGCVIVLTILGLLCSKFDFHRFTITNIILGGLFIALIILFTTYFLMLWYSRKNKEVEDE